MALLLTRTGARRGRLWVVATLAIIGIGMTSYAVANYWVYIEGVLLRFESGIQLTGSSASTRLDMYAKAWKDFQENPILGSSIIEHVHMIYPHNMILESFMAMGIVGGSLSMLIMLFNVRNILVLLRSRPESAWTSVLLVQYSTGAMLSGAIWGNSAFWALTLAVGAIADKPNTK
jgi:O-antigen ligase